MNRELNKEIYSYAITKLEHKLDANKHIENKSILLLQATAVFITLFIFFIDKSYNYKICSEILTFLKLSFYISLSATCIIIFILLNYGIFGKRNYMDTLLPSQILEQNLSNLEDHYEKLIYDFSESINSVQKKNEFMAQLLKWALRIFIISILILIILGILLLFGG
ncbi:MAG: hypothetical protein VR72_08620 [Clostridiaceae bacterium BRH_c20a]|nr:MAG: hypothetical protein VR72_08620 [Clostridiaceae bacterium BRH_c20a]